MTHDGAGNRLTATANIPSLPTLSGTLTYGYDSKDQVTSEARTGGSAFSTTFGYDSAGNATTFKGFTRTYNTKNQLTGGSGLGTFTYDNNGNPTTYNGTTATYDAENHLTSWGTALTAEYTAEGLRAWKQNSASVRTYFLYDGLTPIIEMDGSGNAKAVNTFGANGLVSRRDVSTGTSVFYTFDERGNTTQRLDASGTVLSSRIYDSFGAGLGVSPSTGDPYDGFGAQSGYYTDVETDLILCTWRYYDPTLGRWLTRDPIGYRGGVNLYGYVGNNPVSLIDPLGLEGFDLFGWVGGQYNKIAKGLDRLLDAKTYGWSYAPRWMTDPLENASAAFWQDPVGGVMTAYSIVGPGGLLWNSGIAGANLVRNLHKDIRPGTVAVLCTPSGSLYTGYSQKGGIAMLMHPEIQAVYDLVPAARRSESHMKCAETYILNKAFFDGETTQSIRGSWGAAFNIGGWNSPRHGTLKCPCSSCKWVYHHFEINYLTPR